MPDGGTVTIGAAPAAAVRPEDYPDGCVEISVSDTGTGMPPEVIERAFEPFFTTKGVGKGTGLGLSMVYGVASQSGGSVRIESEAGRGTTVIITLRRAPAAAVADAGPGAAAGEVLRGNGETILWWSMTRMACARASPIPSPPSAIAWSAQPTASPRLRLVMTERPVLAILDFAMPGMNGAEVARAAKAMRPELKVVFASGYAQSEALEAIVGKDATILRKPFAVESLSALVARELGDAS
jgi:CheY-like chemotaxis protein